MVCSNGGRHRTRGGGGGGDGCVRENRVRQRRGAAAELIETRVRPGGIPEAE